MEPADLAVRSSIQSNPGHADIGLTEGATNWLWVVFGIMLISNFCFAVWTFAVRSGSRRYCTLLTLYVSSALSVLAHSITFRCSYLPRQPLRTSLLLRTWEVPLFSSNSAARALRARSGTVRKLSLYRCSPLTPCSSLHRLDYLNASTPPPIAPRHWIAP